MRLPLLATVLTTSVLAAPTVFATESSQTANQHGAIKVRAVQVAMFDLDPTTERGAKALYRRVLNAAERVCMGSIDKRNGLRATRNAEQHAAQCFDEAVAAAVADVRAIAHVDIEQLAGVTSRADSRLSAAR